MFCCRPILCQRSEGCCCGARSHRMLDWGASCGHGRRNHDNKGMTTLVTSGALREHARGKHVTVRPSAVALFLVAVSGLRPDRGHCAMEHDLWKGVVMAPGMCACGFRRAASGMHVSCVCGSSSQVCVGLRLACVGHRCPGKALRLRVGELWVPLPLSPLMSGRFLARAGPKWHAARFLVESCGFDTCVAVQCLIMCTLLALVCQSRRCCSAVRGKV